MARAKSASVHTGGKNFAGLPPASFEQLLDPFAKRSDIARRHVTLGRVNADVVHPVVRHQRNRPPVDGLRREEIHRRVDRSRRLSQPIFVSTRGHDGQILPAKWIRRGLSVLEQPPTVEHVLRHLFGAPSQLRGPEIVRRPLNALHDFLDEKLLILIECLASKNHRFGPTRGRRRVGVSGGHHHVLGRHLRRLLQPSLGFVKSLSGNSRIVGNNKNEPRRPVAKDQAAGVPFIVNLGRFRADESAYDNRSERRSDRARRGPAPRHLRAFGGPGDGRVSLGRAFPGQRQGDDCEKQSSPGCFGGMSSFRDESRRAADGEERSEIQRVVAPGLPRKRRNLRSFLFRGRSIGKCRGVDARQG